MGPHIRNLIRYVAGYLVFKSILPEDVARLMVDDPYLAHVVELAAGGVAAFAVGLWYRLARRFGWAT